MPETALKSQIRDLKDGDYFWAKLQGKHAIFQRLGYCNYICGVEVSFEDNELIFIEMVKAPEFLINARRIAGCEK